MSNYNNFGCTYTDIVNAYRNSIVGDFGGQAVIEAEIELAEAMLIGKLSQKALHSFEVVEYQEVPQVASISGSHIYTPTLPILQDFYCWQIPRYNPAKNNTIYSPVGGCGCNSDCSNIKKELNQQYLFTDYQIVNGNVVFGASFDQSINTYYISYTVDSSSIVLNSIKGMIRDMVAGVLGMQLYSKGDDTWALVKLYNDRATAWLESIDDHWFPSEIRKLKFLNTMFTVKGGITTQKIARS